MGAYSPPATNGGRNACRLDECNADKLAQDGSETIFQIPDETDAESDFE